MNVPLIITALICMVLLALVADLLWPREDPAPDSQPAADDVDGHEVREAHLDAVAAQCFTSPHYVAAILASYEVEVTDLLELGLQLDDLSPKPAAPYED